MASNTTINAKSVNTNDLVISNNGKLNSLSTDNGAVGNVGGYTSLPTSGTLTGNISYTVPDAANTVNLPSNPKRGDTVRFLLIVDGNSGANLIINSSDTVSTPPYFSTTSHVFIGNVGGGTDGISYDLVTVPTAGQRIFEVTNTGTNQCAGVGSQLVATFDGSTWDLQGYIELGGDASSAPTAAFS